MQRRIIGIDLGVRSAHVVAITDETGAVLAKRRCYPTRESLEALEAFAMRDTEPDTRLEVVLEPTGVSWLAVAVFFCRRGHIVYRVSSAKAAALRRFLSQHAKSNAIDAEALARIAIVDAHHLIALELPDEAVAALNRRARAADHLTDQIASAKTRIRELARHVMPTVDQVFTNKFGKADLAVLERYGDPHRLLSLGEKRLTRLIAKESHGYHGEARANRWLSAARDAVELFGDDPAVAFSEIAAELATEARLLRAMEAERELHTRAREELYLVADPTQLARSLPGIAAIGGPVLVSSMGRPSRFRNGAAFKSYTGLAPRASATGDSENKGAPISKAGSSRLRDQLVCSANIARSLDPQLAAVYYTQIVERGAHHTKAICVVAGRLAERAWAVMSRGEPYVICDLDGTPVSPQEAKAIIAERYTVPEEVRRRRRTRKMTKRVGRVPQQVL